MNVLAAIEVRKSVRKYKNEKIDPHTLEQLQSDLDRYTPVFSHAKTRFRVINNYEETQKAKIGFLYGLGKINAPCCIAGICKNNEGMLEIGFALEQEVLKLTDMGYATCWLGTFDRQAIAEMCSLKDYEKVGIVIAVGYQKDDAFMNNGFRRVARSDTRKNFDEICMNHLDKNMDDKIRKMIHLSMLAPSANNGQPVRVKIGHNRADFYLVNDSKIDAGIFISHFYLCALELYHEVKIISENPPKADIPDNYAYVSSILFTDAERI